MRSHSRRYPRIAPLKLTSDASSRSRALKCSLFSVRTGTITHARSISGSSASVAQERTLRGLCLSIVQGKVSVAHDLDLRERPLRRGRMTQPKVASTRIQTSDTQEVWYRIHVPIIATAASASGIAPQ
jgi:hypothetical protein